MSRHARRLTVLTVALTLSLVAGSIPVASASADHDDRGQRHRRSAHALVRQMARAVGGRERLSEIDTVVVTAQGTRWVLDEEVVPGAGAGVPSDYDLELSFDGDGPRLRLDYDIDSSRFGQRSITEILDESGGYLIGQDSNVAPPTAAAMLNDRLVSTQVHQMLMNPQFLIKALLDEELRARFARSVRLGGVRHDVLVVERDGASPLKIFVNRRTRLITKITTKESDALRRDVNLVVRYDRWRWADDELRVPMGIEVHYDGELIQDETRTAVEVNVDLDDDLFEPPPGATPVFDPVLAARGINSHQHLQSFAALGFPLDGLQLTVAATELSPGVHWLAGGTHHSMLVEHDGGLILADAPLNEYRARALLDHIAANFPGQPITHIVQSHHHADHAAGARTVLAEGADLAVHESAAGFWSEIVRAPSRIVPDALALAPVDVDIVTVPDGSFATIGSGDNAVELHSFDQGHAGDLLLVVAGGVAFIVDFYNPFPGAPIPPEGQVVIDLITERGLDVGIIAGGHGGFITIP